MSSPPPPNVIKVGSYSYVIFKIFRIQPFDYGQYTLTLTQGDTNFNCIVYTDAKDGKNQGVVLLQDPAGPYSIIALDGKTAERISSGNLYYGFPFVLSSSSKGGSRRTFTSKRTTAVKSRRVRSRKMRK